MNETLILTTIGLLLAGLLTIFAAMFVFPWLRQRRKIRRAIAVLSQLEDAHSGGVTDLRAVHEALSFDANILHLWSEFQHTLHAERSETDFDDFGQPRIIRYRQTVPAEVYFSTKSLIDVPVRTEFFKHLPGVLTALGIIGTFFGLIIGLAHFDVSGDPDHVNASVKALIGAVRDAFFASAAAIISAIFVTIIEKMAVTGLHADAERLQHTVDEMFDAGAGEDYLSDIARESEATAMHLAHLKDGLINDLKHVMEDFAQRQASAMMLAADRVASDVTETLSAPLNAMHETLERTREDQQQAVHSLLSGVLDSFAERLESVVGEELRGSAGELHRAAEEVREAIGAMPAQVEAAVARIRDVLQEIAVSTEPIAANAERMADASGRLQSVIEQAAETLDYAISRLKSFGAEINDSMESAAQLSASISEGAQRAAEAAESMGATTDALDGASRQLTVASDALATTAAAAKHDSDVQRQLAETVERAAAQLSAAQRDVDAFLEGIAGALAETHEAFSQQINGTLNRSHEAFHHNMANATERLAGTVHDFGDFLEGDFKGSVDQLHRELTRLGAADNANGNGHGAVA